VGWGTGDREATNAGDTAARLRLVQTGLTLLPLAGTSPTIGLPAEYGLGIADAGGMFGHNGEVPGYTAEMWYLPSIRGTVVALFNSITPCESTPDRLGPPVRRHVCIARGRCLRQRTSTIRAADAGDLHRGLDPETSIAETCIGAWTVRRRCEVFCSRA
jgi:hypothetical protein